MVPAAGTGERMGGIRKPFLEVGGLPLLAHALRPFLEHPSVGSVAVALSPPDASNPPEWLAGMDPRIRIVPGGRTRAHSVKAGLDALEVGVDVVVVHDAARPLVTREVIDRCIGAATEGDGAVAGWPVVDTLKEVDDEGLIVSTPDRSRYWRAQTPQVFPFEPLVDAYRRALEEDVPATDDASVFSRFGGRVRVVEGAAWNLKVTHPDDVLVARALLERALLEREGRDRVPGSDEEDC